MLSLFSIIHRLIEQGEQGRTPHQEVKEVKKQHISISPVDHSTETCIMAEGDTNPMGDDALAEMQIDEVRAPPGPDNCGPFWHWEISEEQLVEL
ncbi:expressed unknown protein [Seminavis robusta]|uniref:Uncharacterized protein n=1 Tax=Seminavis robusta TaxID=568900 RepID=A0A9N8HRY8_9STRA|nr:expressed unknown protein [Seminavis robusta]|eukprot:Sro1372_g267160.1 n/a (94) ;mRNA; r:11440-11980